ncbi:DUF445 domain-containing protein [Halobacillus sp. A5]|uniref:DUF445 domain-containing protein n=1 Tax=Halobacillus sp. A5 TaxID=2880263 RepID=UPI0020A6775D|nr:DUF445 family protein [Halobacillus sp. A5]MCP3026769.1 DUF445 family protein [Halobacillus sp. A5]
MNTSFLILFMMLIGAAIGGVTNSLAIKMLFRPYQAIYIGKFRLPFTPGVIPKRQKELARQLGRMVVNHLLTAEGLKRKIKGQDFQNQLTTFAQNEVEKALQNDQSLQQLLNTLQLDIDIERVEEAAAEWVDQRYNLMMEELRQKKVKNILSDDWLYKAEAGTDQLAGYIQLKVQHFLMSREGKEKVGALIDDYLDKQGFLGNMIQSFMGSDRVIDRVHPVIVRYVSAKETTEWLQTMLQTELENALEQPLGYFEDKIGKGVISTSLGQVVTKALPVEKWLNQSVSEWTKPLQSKILLDVLPALVPKTAELLSSKIETMMASMNLAEIVQEQVESFNVGRLEEMVLDISRKEFKMITYLGALLGGIIGLLQGIIVLFIG